MSFRFLDHTADIAVYVNGSSYEELFISAAAAWQKSASDFISKKPSRRLNINFHENSPEELLVRFLSELNFNLYAKRLFYLSAESVVVNKTGDLWTLSAVVHITDCSEQSIYIKEEIKAITFHNMHIEKEDNLFSVQIIFDI